MGVELSAKTIEQESVKDYLWQGHKFSFLSNSPEGCRTKVIEITEGMDIRKVDADKWEAVVKLDEEKPENEMLVILDEKADNYLRVMRNRKWLIITSGEVNYNENGVMELGRTSNPVKIPEFGNVMIEFNKENGSLNARRER